MPIHSISVSDGHAHTNAHTQAEQCACGGSSRVRRLIFQSASWGCALCRKSFTDWTAWCNLEMVKTEETLCWHRDGGPARLRLCRRARGCIIPTTRIKYYRVRRGVNVVVTNFDFWLVWLFPLGRNIHVGLSAYYLQRLLCLKIWQCSSSSSSKRP